MEQPPRKSEDVSPIFGLRYLEEEDAEINGIAGCIAITPREPSDGSTQYTTNCDYADSD